MNKNIWIKKALILGFSFFIAIYIIKPVGVSTQFSVLSGIIHSSIDKDVITKDSSRETGYKSTNEYYDKSDGKIAKEIKNPLNYGFIFVLSIPLGSYIGLNLKNRKDTSSNESCSVNIKDKPFIKKYFPSFIGGFLLLFGARMADGCTSGHMMSGMMQGSISGYIFAFAAFLSAIPTAILIKKIRKEV